MTLNQIVSRLRSLSLSHYQINSFFFGEVPDFDANEDLSYPACLVNQLPGSINRTEHLQKFVFRIYLLDRVGVSEDTKGNQTEVLSDMSSIAADLLAVLNYSGYNDDWLIEEVTPVTPVTEALGDMVAGVYLDVTIGIEYLADRCQVPMGDVTFETNFDMARTKLITYTATGSEGAAYEVPGLAGKEVLCIYRAGGYRRPIVTVPTDSDKIQVVGTDNGSKGIYSTTGYVGLQVGDTLLPGEILDFLIWSI